MLKKVYIVVTIVILNLILIFTADSFGQSFEPVYSQYWVNGLAINPAYAGSRECFSNTVLYRNQWMGFGNGAPQTGTFSSHTPFKDQKNSAGLFISYEHIGVTKVTDYYANYAFRFQLGNGKLSLGLSAGARDFIGNFDDIKASPDELSNDPVLNKERATLPNVGVGVYYYTDKYFVGLSVPKLLSYESNNLNEMSFSADNYDFLITAGYLFELSEIVKFKPSFLVKYRYNNAFQIDGGVNFILYDALWAGFSYRYKDEYTVMLEYQATDQIRAGVAYDFATNDLSKYNNGSLEIILRYDFKYKIRAVSPRYF